MNFKATINGKTFDIAIGNTFADNLNEKLDSATIILNHIEEIDLKPFYDVIITDNDNPSFKKHYLVDNYTKTRLSLNENCYKYKIALMSETKGLEKIQIPNISITQPLNINNKKTVYQYLIEFVEEYNIKLRIKNADGWVYQNKYTIDSSLSDIYSNVYAPDFTLNNPNLKDVLTQLMLTKDRIPKVEDNVIKAFDLTLRNGVFSFNPYNENYIIESQKSDEYSQNLKTNYSDALSQDKTAHIIEKMGFRNSEEGLLTLANMRLETRFPIYKINKIYMCYYKEVDLIPSSGNGSTITRRFLCKQDITPLVKLNSERNTLSLDWESFEAGTPGSIDQIGKYKLATLGYNIGDNVITGWGETYSYVRKGTWWDETKSYIENIFIASEKISPMGIYSYNFLKEGGFDDYIISWKEASINNILTPMGSKTLTDASKLKSLIFEVDYNAFYNGTIIHSKDHDFGNLVDNDNQNQSLSLLEASGLFEKEKINRLGNKEFSINGRYNSLNEVKPLGAVWEDDIIVYSREIACYKDYVEVCYHLIKDYVLRNYYTSVWAKHRTYNLMTYNESVRRSENKKVFLYMSKNYSYDEVASSLNFYNFGSDSVISFYDTMMSAFNETSKITSKNLIDTTKQINNVYFKVGDNYYLSDINSFVSGYSLCFNTTMFDNVSAGVYIDRPNPTFNIDIDPDTDSATGSGQRWWLMVDSQYTGQIANIEVCFSHIENDAQYYDGKMYSKDELNDDIITDLFNKNIFLLPKTTLDTDNLSYQLRLYEKVNKDNKEVLDYTFQIEPISENDDILFSQWFMKLNDLLATYQKSKTTYDISDAVSQGFAIKGRAVTMKYGSISYTANPIAGFILDINTDYMAELIGKNLNYEYEFDNVNGNTPNSANTSLFKCTMNLGYMTSVHYGTNESGKNEIVAISGYATFNVWWRSMPNYAFAKIVDNQTITVTFYRFGKKQRMSNIGLYNEYWEQQTTEATNTFSFGAFFSDLYVLNANKYAESNGIDFGNTQVYPFGVAYVSEWITALDLDGSSQIRANQQQIIDSIPIITGNPNEQATFKKNMFFYGKSGKISKNIVYNELRESDFASFYYTQINNVSTNIRIDEKNNVIFRINFGGSYQYDTIEYRFFNSDSNSYHFVFGVNLSVEEKAQGYCDIYLSLLRSGDFRVYSDSNFLNYVMLDNNVSVNKIRQQTFYNGVPIDPDIPTLLNPIITNIEVSLYEEGE